MKTIKILGIAMLFLTIACAFASSQALSREEIDSLIGPGTYSEKQVEEIIFQLMAAAEDELTKIAEETGAEVKAMYDKRIADIKSDYDLKIKKMRDDYEVRLWAYRIGLLVSLTGNGIQLGFTLSK